MKILGQFVSLILIIIGMVGCDSKTASNLPEDSTSAASIANEQQTEVAKSGQDSALKPQSAQTPFTVATQSESLPVPNLIPPTTSAVRVPQSQVGRPDPFATILDTPTISVKPSSNAGSSSTSLPAAPTVAALPSTSTLPSLPSLQTAPITEFPPVSVPNLPPPRPLSETIEISGVVEVAGKTSVIIQSPEEHTSRYVHVGDYVGNGKVLVKRVEMGAEPVVVLEENGAEVTRYVGGGSSLAGLL